MGLVLRAVALCVGLLGFGSAALAQTKITIAYTASAEAVAAYVAKEEGYFAKRGLDADLVLIALNSTIPQAMYANSVQFGGLTPSVHLQAVDGGLDLVVVTGGTVTHPTTLKIFGVVARSGTDIKNPKDFVGKKVGVPGFGAFLHVLFRNWLVENGVDPKAVNFVEVSFPTMNDVLKGGSVDAVVTLDPVMARIVAAGTGTLVPNYELPVGQLVTFYSATRDWAAKNPAAVKAFQEAMTEAAAFVRTNPEKSREYVAKYTKLPIEIVKTLTLPWVEPSVSEVQVGWWASLMKTQGMLQTNIDIGKQIYR
jgi:NitT/TauT family transport system substrate-binding protein